MDALVPAPTTAFIAKPATPWTTQTHVQVRTMSMSPVSVYFTFDMEALVPLKLCLDPRFYTVTLYVFLFVN